MDLHQQEDRQMEVAQIPAVLQNNLIRFHQNLIAPPKAQRWCAIFGLLHVEHYSTPAQ